jgi:hypothetical protein
MQILITIIRFSNNLPPLPGTISKINSNNGSITDESNIKTWSPSTTIILFSKVTGVGFGMSSLMLSELQ